MLGVENLTVRYGPQTALEHASVRFEAGSFSAIIGPNGAGKSTLLKTLVGLLPDPEGAVRSDPGHTARGCISYVPQQQTLDWGFPVTVWDVAMMGRTGRLGWLRWPGRKDRQIVEDALKETGVFDLRGATSARCPGAAAAGAAGPHAGPPGPPAAAGRTPDRRGRRHPGNPDGPPAAAGRQGRAVVMVTHDLEQARRWCDHLVLVNRRVIADGTPEQVYTTQNIEATFSTSFLGHTHAEA